MLRRRNPLNCHDDRYSWSRVPTRYWFDAIDTSE
jgi:hypothetical protein